MKVILLDNLKELGNKYDVKDVANGYARNFLLPKGLAKLATKPALLELEKLREIEKVKQEKGLAKFQEIAKKLDGQEIEISMKTGESGALYGSITTTKISEVLNKKGFEIDKDQIVMKDPIKGLGEFDVTVKFPHNLETNIKVVVSAKSK